MPYWCAAFGPNNSYFFNSPHKWSMCGLPDRINSLFTTEPKAKEIHEIALGPNGSYAIIFSDSTGIKVRHSGLPQAVEQWLLNYSGRAINSARDLASLQISLGPNNSYFAFDKNGCIWGGLPLALDAAVNERRDSNGCFKPGAYPYLVSLGADGTYAMITVGGGGSWNLGGQNPLLEQCLNRMGSLMHTGIVLSPFDINHYLLVTGQGEVAGFVPEISTPAYLAFAEDWRLSIQAETMPPPPPAGPPVQTEYAPHLPPRRPSSIAADAQIRQSYVPYTPIHEHRPSLPARPFSDTMPAYTANAPHTTQAVGPPPPPLSPPPNTSTLQTQPMPKSSPPSVQRRPVKAQENANTASTKSPPIEQTSHFPPPPPYSPNPAAIPVTEIKTAPPMNHASAAPINPSPQMRQFQQPAPTPQDYAQAKAAAKAKRNQRIATGLKVGKMAMQGVSIGLALANIASGNVGSIPSIPSFDFGGGSDVPVPDVPDVPVADTSAYWQPLQDCASMPIQ